MNIKCNEKISGRIIWFDDRDTDFRATFMLDEYYQTVIEIYEISTEIAREYTCGESIFAVFQADCDVYMNVFNLHVKKKVSKTIDEKPLLSMELLSSITLINETMISKDTKFSSFEFKITDGYELIGLCPYQFDKNEGNILIGNTIEIPAENKNITVEFDLGIFTFDVFPSYKFSFDGLKIGFNYRIVYKNCQLFDLANIRRLFHKICSFFELISGESITVNECFLFEAMSNRDHSCELIGCSNFPKDKLNIFRKKQFDAANYLRRSIFKISDFQNLNCAFNAFFQFYESSELAVHAYQRFLLDEEMNTASANKFLAAMQLVEGFENEISKEDELTDFENKKSEIVMRLDTDEDKEFIRTYCNYIGIVFLRRLKNFTKRSIVILNEISGKEFKSKYDNLMCQIRDSRDIYTHSSCEKKSTFSVSELQKVAELYKGFYRINILSKMGLSNNIIRYRFAYDRKFVSYLKKFFDIELEYNNEMNVFDNEMRWISKSDK